jgi:hypothetical protein
MWDAIVEGLGYPLPIEVPSPTKDAPEQLVVVSVGSAALLAALLLGGLLAAAFICLSRRSLCIP